MVKYPKTAKKIARDQGIYNDIYWTDPKQAAVEVYDLVFDTLLDNDPVEAFNIGIWAKLFDQDYINTMIKSIPGLKRKIWQT